jgi:hypothetical protein
MAVFPRSQALLRHQAAVAADDHRFTCPAGMITLVKSYALWNNGAASTSVLIQLVTADGSLAVPILSQTVAQYTGLTGQLWTVLNPGDQLSVYSSIAGLVSWISGAVLQGSPVVPPA